MSHVIGIDPGKTGGLAVLDTDGKLTVHPMMADVNELCGFFSFYAPNCEHIFIEKSSARPGQGVVSMFTYGVGFGTLLGIIHCKALPHTLVPPAAWAKVMHAGTKLNPTKLRSLEAAMRLFPAQNWKETIRTQKAHMGMVEAALIASYGRRTLGMLA